MKAILKAGHLLTIVEKGMASIAVPPKSVVTMAEFGKLAFEDDKIGIRTSHENASSYCIQSIEDGETIEDEGACVVSMPRLRSMLKILSPDSEVSVLLKPPVSGEDGFGNVFFKSGKSKWKMPTIHEDTIVDPRRKKGKVIFSAPKPDIAKAFKAVSFAGNVKDANFIQSNVCISVHDNELFFGATDEVRCAAFKISVDESLELNRILIPIAAYSPILRTFDKGDIEVCSGDGHVSFCQEQHVVKISLPTESDVNNFPNFEALIAGQHPVRIEVMASRLKDIVSACNQMNQEECLMRIADGELEFFAYDIIDGMAYHSSLNHTGDSVKIDMGLCPVYIVDFLSKVTEDTVFIEFPIASGKPKHIKLVDDGGHYFIMKALVDLIHLPPQVNE